MKSYIDIEQSKKLAKILPIESADMCWVTDEIEPLWGVVKSEPDDKFEVIPSWSLAALLQIMPHCIDDRYDLVSSKLTDNKGWYVMYDDVDHFTRFYVTHSDLIDACVEMILKLHEQKTYIIMDYEEKYKKSLDKAMNLFVTNNISATAVCKIFPELNESEEINYEKKYKKALKWMQSLYDGLHGATKEDAEHYFPELKESEDERIRKAIKKALQVRCTGSRIISDEPVTLEEAIAWLEKQGENKKLDADKVIAWLVANICDFEYYVNLFKKDFGL